MLKLCVVLAVLALATAQKFKAHVFIQCDCDAQETTEPGTTVEMMGFRGSEPDWYICKKLCYKGYTRKGRSKRQAGFQGFPQGFGGTQPGYGFSQASPIAPFGSPGPAPVAFQGAAPITRPSGLGGDCAYGCTCGGCNGGKCNWGCQQFYHPVKPALAPHGAKIVPPFFAGRAHPFGPAAYNGAPYNYGHASQGYDINLNYGLGYGLNGYGPLGVRTGPLNNPQPNGAGGGGCAGGQCSGPYQG